MNLKVSRGHAFILQIAVLVAIVCASSCTTITPQGFSTPASTSVVVLSDPLTTQTSTQQPSEVSSVIPNRGITNVKLWIFPDDNEQALLDTISSATQRVLLSIYLLTDYRFITALQSAHRNGADVRVLLEENPYRGDSAARQAFDRLSRAGINVKHSSPQFRFTHQKSLVIDNQGVIMTANLTKSAFSSNRDFAVMYSNRSGVAEMVRVFEADWNRTSTQQNSPYLLWSPVNSRERLNQLINSAQSTIDVYAEIAQDDGITELLIQAARRQVDIRLVISPQLNPEDSNKPNLDAMQHSGVAVRYLRSPYIHAKMFLVDNVIGFIGSQNISATSMEFNRELGILIADQNALQKLSAIFLKDWQKAKNR